MNRSSQTVFVQVSRVCCRRVLASIIAVSCVASTTSLHASVQYSGSIQDPTDLILGNWNSATLDWLVTDNENGTWNYWYKFEYSPTKAGGLSHITFEISLNVDSLDLITEINVTGGELGEVELDQGGGGSNPGIPGDFTKALKFNIDEVEEQDIGTVTISFDIPRMPTWGDFYAKGGNDRFAYNSGFVDDEDADTSNDPTDYDPDDGPLIIDELAHILVPDSVAFPPPIDDPVVPEPTSVAVWSLIVGLATFVASRKK